VSTHRWFRVSSILRLGRLRWRNNIPQVEYTVQYTVDLDQGITKPHQTKCIRHPQHTAVSEMEREREKKFKPQTPVWAASVCSVTKTRFLTSMQKYRFPSSEIPQTPTPYQFQIWEGLCEKRHTEQSKHPVLKFIASPGRNA
jgi:hypothetical protein